MKAANGIHSTTQTSTSSPKGYGESASKIEKMEPRSDTKFSEAPTDTVIDKFGGYASDIGSAVVSGLTKSVGQGYDLVKSKSQVYSKDLRRVVEQRPLTALALAAGAGVLLGRVLCRNTSKKH